MVLTLLAVVLLQQPREGWDVIDGKVTISEKGCRMEGPAHVNSKPVAARPRAIYRLSARVQQLSGVGDYMVALIWRDKAGKVLRVDNAWMGKDRPVEESPHGGRFTSPAGTHDAVVSLGVQQETICLFNEIGVRFEKMAPPYDLAFRWLDANDRPIDAPLKIGLDPAGFTEPQGSRLVSGWKPIGAGFRSSSFPVEAGHLYVVDGGKRAIGFAPSSAARCQVEVVQRGEFDFEKVRLWKVTKSAPPLKPNPTALWICPDFRMGDRQRPPQVPRSAALGRLVPHAGAVAGS